MLSFVQLSSTFCACTGITALQADDEQCGLIDLTIINSLLSFPMTTATLSTSVRLSRRTSSLSSRRHDQHKKIHPMN